MESLWLAILLGRICTPGQVVHNSPALITRATDFLVDIPIEGPVFDLVEVVTRMKTVALALGWIRNLERESRASRTVTIQKVRSA